jgi:hypothetical protein
VAGGTTGQGNLRGGSTGNGTEGYYGGSGLGAGVHALALGGKAVALYAEASLAGLFLGDVAVQGTLAASVKAFKIDHPLDPANRFLTHSSIECPDMMNIYNGNVVTDQDGRAHIVLPNYFQALNREFRYQLTPISGFSQVTVEQEIEDNRFSIRTDKPHVHVSWQVTGVRHDAYAEAHHIEVEQDKSEAERGRYLHPELYGTVAGAERRSIGYLPGMFGDPSVVHYSASDDGTPT